MNISRENVARKSQLFNNCSSLWEDTSYHFKNIGDIPHIYARYCAERVFYVSINMNMEEDAMYTNPFLSPIKSSQ